MRRLDQLQTAIYADALEGDLSSQQMYLRIADQRARLLGLYPKEPQLAMSLNAANNGQLEAMRIEFVLPEPQEPPPVDVTPEPQPDYSKPALPPPPERRRGPRGLWLEEAPGKADWMK